MDPVFLSAWTEGPRPTLTQTLSTWVGCGSMLDADLRPVTLLTTPAKFQIRIISILSPTVHAIVTDVHPVGMLTNYWLTSRSDLPTSCVPFPTSRQMPIATDEVLSFASPDEL